jgi:flagella basal body P-ring formation protein FlgA
MAACPVLLATADAADFIRPRLMVKEHAVVTDKAIYLEDISYIVSNDPQQVALVEALKRVELGEAPPPRTTTTLLGPKVLERIAEAGISLSSFGYSVPQAITVQRSGQIISKAEVLDALRQSFKEEAKLDLQVRDVQWPHAQVVPEGRRQVTVKRLGAPAGGKIPVRIQVLVNNETAARFLASAIVDDWREVPVVRRTLDRGMLIRPEDIQMVRLNLFKQPHDVLSALGDVIGLRVKSRLAAGDVIRKSRVAIPPVIDQGKRITLIYRIGNFEASAVGLAMDDGLEGELIRVKNTTSQRVVHARVVDPQTAEVNN